MSKEPTFDEWLNYTPDPDDVRIHLLSPDQRAEYAERWGEVQAVGEVRDADGNWHAVAYYPPDAMWETERR